MRTHMYQIHWKTTTYNVPSHWLQSFLVPIANSTAEEYRLVKYIYITYCIYFSFHRSLPYLTSPFSSCCLSYFFSYHYHTHFPHTCFSTTHVTITPAPPLTHPPSGTLPWSRLEPASESTCTCMYSMTMEAIYL